MAVNHLEFEILEFGYRIFLLLNQNNFFQLRNAVPQATKVCGDLEEGVDRK